MNTFFKHCIHWKRRALGRLTSAARAVEAGRGLSAPFPDRTGLLVPSDFRHATVLDLSADNGLQCFKAVEWGAVYVRGIVYDKDLFTAAEQRRTASGLDFRLAFICDDINLFACWNAIGCSDVVLFPCTIPAHSRELRHGALARSTARTGRVMYYEGRPGTTREHCLDELMTFTDFSSIVYKGDLKDPDGRTIPVFRCTRETLTQKGAARTIAGFIRSGTYRKMAVIGKSGSGKSYTRKLVAAMLTFDHDYILADDKCDYAYINSLPKLVYFVCGALEYLEDAEAVFFIAIDEEVRRNLLFRGRLGRFIMTKWFGHRVLPEHHYTVRSPRGEMRAVRAIYTIRR